MLIPQGGSGWGGVAFGSPVDPRASNVTLTATIDVPSDGCSGCIDAAGVGLVDAIPAMGERVSLRMAVLVNRMMPGLAHGAVLTLGLLALELIAVKAAIRDITSDDSGE